MEDLNIFVNVTSRNEHVPEAEQNIRTIKERVRSTINTLPFKKSHLASLLNLYTLVLSG